MTDAPAAPVGRLPRLPQLDGLRAVAVALVIGFHLSLSLTMPLTVRKWLAPVIGNDGVTLFFVLSGYLITSLLVREQLITGRISLPNFAARRALRIAPAFCAYMALTAILVGFGALHISWLHVGLAAIYVWDYVPATVPWLGHLWSLATEEQFYLLWPLTLVLLRTRWALRVAMAGVVAGPFIRWATYDAYPADRARLGFMAHEHVDALLAGAALAIAPAATPRAYRWLTEHLLRWHVDALALLAYFVAAPYLLLKGSLIIDEYLIGSLYAVAGALLIHGLVERPDGVAARVLAHPVPRHVGVASYSLYLWQQPWMLPTASLAPVVRVLGALASAEVSLRLVERPFLKLKSRLRSPGAAPYPATGAALP